MPKDEVRPGGLVRRRGAGIVAGALALVVVATGCSAPTSGGSAPGLPLVATTFTVLADITRQVAGDRARVESITRPGAEVHGYEPTSGDLRRVADADLLVDNGLGLEAWFSRFTDRSDAERVVASAGVTPIPLRGGVGSDADSVGQPNPHAWMSPTAGATYVRNITDALVRLDPDSESHFRARAAAYTAELEAIGDELAARLRDVPPASRMLVTCEGAFSYLTRDAGLDEGYLWGVNSDRQGTPRQIAALITTLRDREVPAVFCESTVSDTAMRQVARETDAAFAGTLYVDSLSGPDGPVPTYLDLLRHDVETIAAGLGAR